MEEVDREAVGLLGWEAWRSNGPLDRGMADPKVAQKVRDAFLRFPFEYARPIILAEQQGRVVGWTARDMAADSLSDLWIAPDHQERRVGRALLDHVCAQIAAEGSGQAVISTHQNNFRAIGLYKSCGFDIIWQGMAKDFVMAIEIPQVRLRRNLG